MDAYINTAAQFRGAAEYEEDVYKDAYTDKAAQII